MAHWLILTSVLLAAAVPVRTQAQDALSPNALPATQAMPEEIAVEDTAPIDAVDVFRDRHQRMTVPVTIAGRGPYSFLIDTGAQATVVTRRIVEDLGIEPNGRANLIALGSSQIVETVELDELEFADRSFSGLVTPLLENEHIGADGILGLDSLQDLRVLIDFRDYSMQVADADQADNNRGYEIIVRARRKLGQMIITDARINGVRTALIIDTGAQNSMGNMALLRRLRAQEGADVIATDVNGMEVRSQLAIAKRLTIGDMELTSVPIGFADSPAFDALGFADKPAVILGMGNLRIFERVAIDFATRRVLFDLPGDASLRNLSQQFVRATRIDS